MALIVYDKRSKWNEAIHKNGNIPTKFFRSKEEVQREYCNCIEHEVTSDFEIPFFENSNVKEYLESFGVKYKGNYILDSDDWGDGCGKGERFVTHLYYTLQMGCIMLYEPDYRYVIKNDSLFELKYLLPILKKMDVYVILDDMSNLLIEYGDYLDDFVGMGLELIANGKSISGTSEGKQISCLIDMEYEYKLLTREVDLEYFPRNFAETRIFTPYKTTYEEYVYKTTVQSQYMKRKIKDITVVVNGRNKFDGTWRRYPIHYLYEFNGEWKYIEDNSVKYPDMTELFEDIFLNTERFDWKAQKNIDVSNAGKLLVLVLDCDELCDAVKYWKHVAFVAKYDKETKTIEICDMSKGILEFHELLQKSTDLIAENITSND